MNRRDLLKTAVAGIFAPLIRLSPARDADMADLVQEFCDVDPDLGSPRGYCFTDPYEFHGHALGTDARAMIEVPDLAYTRTSNSGRRPDFQAVFDDHWPTETTMNGRRWAQLPKPRRFAGRYRSSCPYCSRHEHARCEGCGCERCHWQGYVAVQDCPLCHGRYHANIPWIEVLGDQRVNTRYLDLCRRIPGAMWIPGRAPKSPILVRGDGGVRALVMPIV